MRRRELVPLLVATLTSARSLRAQQQKTVPVIGFLNGGSADKFAPYFAAFRNGLAAMGYVDGQNVQIEYRNAEGHYDRLPAFAADLVQRNVSAIATFSLPAVRAAKAATGTIPIVFATGVNPVTAGLVASFNRPGGNLTGISMSESAMADKQIEMLHEIVPKAELMGVLVNQTNHSPCQRTAGQGWLTVGGAASRIECSRRPVAMIDLRGRRGTRRARRWFSPALKESGDANCDIHVRRRANWRRRK